MVRQMTEGVGIRYKTLNPFQYIIYLLHNVHDVDTWYPDFKIEVLSLNSCDHDELTLRCYFEAGPYEYCTNSITCNSREASTVEEAVAKIVHTVKAEVMNV